MAEAARRHEQAQQPARVFAEFSYSTHNSWSRQRQVVAKAEVTVVFGNEVEGVAPEISERADLHVRVPTLGRKQSLNVAAAGGVVTYELLRKYGLLHQEWRQGMPGNDRRLSGDKSPRFALALNQ